MKTNPKEFVSQLVLAAPNHAIDRLDSRDAINVALQSAHPNQPEAYINNKIVISFASDVKGLARQDILNSTLLAQLAASKKFPGEADVLQWYGSYKEVLSNIGWNIQQFEFSDFSSSQNIFEMENVILDVLGAAVGGSYLAVIVKTLEAFKKLSDSDNKVLAFERNTHSLKKGTFQLGLAQETNGALALNAAAFILESTHDIRKILLFKSEKENFSLRLNLFQATLNESMYQLARNEILAKIGQYVPKYVAELEI